MAVRTVTHAQLELAAAKAPAVRPAPSVSARVVGQRPLLKDVLDRHGIAYREQPPDANCVTWYHVERCPFHEDGRSFECGVGQRLPDGPYAGHCFHPEGEGKGWHDFKAALGLRVQASEARATNMPSTNGGPVKGPSSSISFISSSDTVHRPEAPPWPEPLAEAAFHGPVGDAVRAIAPHTEADPAALLVQMLVAVGNVMGRHAYVQVEADLHFPNLFVLVVGDTAKARKGVSSGHATRLAEAVDPEWRRCCHEGLSSGEGLIWAIRDPIVKREKSKRSGAYEEVEVDHGVDDKRLMVRESEFAGVLKAAARETNTLTAIIRRAWDSPGLLQTMTKNSPARASNPHVSIVGHITQDELTRLLNTAEAVNGFLNRFLIICVRRSKLLPEGGAITTVEFGPIHRDLCAAVAQARTPLQVQFDASGRQAWNDLYYRLADPRPGLVGAITARAEAHCLRLSLLYALLDRTTAIGAVHVRAAEAVWNYADASAVHLFGDRLGNPLADELLARLRQAHAGLTRTEISGLFSRNRSREALSRTLEELATRGLARMTAVATDGRPAEVWHATRPTGISDETNERDEKRVPSRGPEASKDLSDGYETNEEDERRLPSVDAGDHGTSESVPLVHHASDEAGSAAARPQEFTL